VISHYHTRDLVTGVDTGKITGVHARGTLEQCRLWLEEGLRAQALGLALRDDIPVAEVLEWLAANG
jgi:hypothetical protein